MRFAIEPKPNEPRGDIFLPTVGHALHFITTLARPDMVGVNPEVAHETMAGLSFHHGVGQALWAGKLFHIDLNGQRIGRYDQDFRFGAEDLKEAFHLVRLLERAGYDGPRHFDAHAYRTEDAEGVWEFARGCMATYRALADAAQRFDADPDVREALAAASVAELGEPTRRRRRRRDAQGRGRRARRARRARLRQRAARPARRRGPARRPMSVAVGLDVGTSGVKALAVSETGEVLARAEVGYGLSTPRPGWAEQDPADWWRATEEALAALAVRRGRRDRAQRPDARARRARRAPAR